MTREQIEAILKGCEGVTPGRWIAAAKPSSVVGWPVVSEAGRSIASMNYVHWSEHNPAVSGDRTFNRESKANAEHIARLDPGTVSELCRLALVGLAAQDAYRRGQEDMRERAANAVTERATAQGRQECCGLGVGSPPECCGNAVFMIDDMEASAAIRSLPIEGEGK